MRDEKTRFSFIPHPSSLILAKRRTLAMPHGAKQPLVGLDLNSSRARAVTTAPGQAPELLPIAGEAELPLAVSLEGRSPEAGRAGLSLVRRAPHLACANFLPSLGGPRQW